jgi:hypothetical protein
VSLNVTRRRKNVEHPNAVIAATNIRLIRCYFRLTIVGRLTQTIGTHMTRRRLALLALLVALVLLGVGGWLVLGPEKIRRGMTRTEVEAILGPPDGRMLAIEGKAIEDVVLVWKNRIVVEFDDVNRVREVTRPPSLISNLHGRFGF